LGASADDLQAALWYRRKSQMTHDSGATDEAHLPISLWRPGAQCAYKRGMDEAVVFVRPFACAVLCLRMQGGVVQRVAGNARSQSLRRTSDPSLSPGHTALDIARLP
jgi:hypothetical protein